MAKGKGPILGGIVVVLVVVGIPLTAWLLRGVIATSMARSELEARGFTCDDQFSVGLSAGLGEATLGPTRCEHEGGVLEAVELLGDVTIELSGTEPESIRADSIRLQLRSTNVRGGQGWAASLARIDLEQRVAGVLKGISEFASLGLPVTEAARVELVRGDDPLGHVEQIAMTPEGEGTLGLRFSRARFAAGPMNVGQLDLTGVNGHATASEVTLSGRARARAGVAVIFNVERSGPFSLSATGLNTSNPSFELNGQL